MFQPFTYKYKISPWGDMGGISLAQKYVVESAFRDSVVPAKCDLTSHWSNISEDLRWGIKEDLLWRTVSKGRQFWCLLVQEPKAFFESLLLIRLETLIVEFLEQVQNSPGINIL